MTAAPQSRSRAWSVLVPAGGLAACPPHPEAAAHPRADGTSPEARRCQRWTLIVVCLASALLLFNVTAPNVALPALAVDLGAGFAEQQWVLSIYALVLASLLLAGGALGDSYGRRRIFLVGLGVFGLGSLACAIAPSAVLLIAARAVQGLGAALLFPAGLSLIAAEFSGDGRARAIGVWGASVAGAIALGPLVGGLLVQLSGWRAEFWFAVVLLVPTALMGLRHLREGRADAATRLDWLGTALLTGAMSLLVVLVQRANAVGWTSPVTVVMALASVALLAGFVVAEFRVREPLIAPALLRNPTFLGATFVALVFAAAGFAPLVYITVFLLQVAGSGPILAGLQIAPFALASLVVSLLAARVTARLGARVALAGGLALCGIGVAMMLPVTADGAGLRLLPGLVVFGVGAGIVNPTMTVAALGTVDAAHSGMASGVNNTARQLGIAIGIAALGAVLQARLDGGMRAGLLQAGLPGPAAQRAADLAAGGDLRGAASVLGPAGRPLRPVYDATFTSALHTVFVLAIAVVIVGVAAVFFLIRAPRAAARFVVADGGSCDHLGELGEGPPPRGAEGCEDCVREGSQWVHLRQCLGCGRVGCCDSSPRRHAAGHWRASGHPLIRSAQPGEDWGWCYPDEQLLIPAQPGNRQP